MIIPALIALAHTNVSTIGLGNPGVAPKHHLHRHHHARLRHSHRRHASAPAARDETFGNAIVPVHDLWANGPVVERDHWLITGYFFIRGLYKADDPNFKPRLFLAKKDGTYEVPAHPERNQWPLLPTWTEVTANADFHPTPGSDYVSFNLHVPDPTAHFGMIGVSAEGIPPLLSTVHETAFAITNVATTVYVRNRSSAGQSLRGESRRRAWKGHRVMQLTTKPLMLLPDDNIIPIEIHRPLDLEERPVPVYDIFYASIGWKPDPYLFGWHSNLGKPDSLLAQGWDPIDRGSHFHPSAGRDASLDHGAGEDDYSFLMVFGTDTTHWNNKPSTLECDGVIRHVEQTAH